MKVNLKHLFVLMTLGTLAGAWPGLAQTTTVLAQTPEDHGVYLPIVSAIGNANPGANVIVDTGQTQCYNDAGAVTCPRPGESFYGQDAQYGGVLPSYVDNGDGTVTDLNTGLMWQKTPDLDNKSTYAEAVAGADTFNLAGYDDWRLPTIKELYSLIDFNGSARGSATDSTPYIDTSYFDFEYGDMSSGERLIDAQYWSSTEYVGTVFNGEAAVFGVNFADGRIKGYPRDTGPGGSMTAFVRYVRGNPDYGVNNFVNNGDGTISDLATGLMWQQADDGATRDWDGALSFCEGLSLAGYDDWRLPNAKELQSIVDYTRAPDAQEPAQRGAAIDPVFDITSDDSYFWTSTTHLDGSRYWAVYIAFGEAWGYMEQPPNSGSYALLNVHGAGAQRSDPKAGDAADWPTGNGPQGDVVRIYNYVRCVRGGAELVEVTDSGTGEPAGPSPAGDQLPGGGPPGGNRSPAGQSPGGSQPPGGRPPAGAPGQSPMGASPSLGGP